MRSTFFPSSSDPSRPSRRRRASGFLLVLAIHILIIVILFRPGAPLSPFTKPEPKIFKVLSYSEEPDPEKPARRARKAANASAPRKPVTPAIKVPPPIVPPIKPLNMLILSQEEFAAADIGKLPSRQGDRAPVGPGAGQDAGNAEGQGEGPGGERLYNAEWYVEPTQAELAYYMPAGSGRPGSAMIACRTIPNFHVEDCRELGESPPGSGLARALRQAAWQFRVRPPRIGGRPMIGTWVRIRFDFNEVKAK